MNRGGDTPQTQTHFAVNIGNGGHCLVIADAKLQLVGVSATQYIVVNSNGVVLALSGGPESILNTVVYAKVNAYLGTSYNSYEMNIQSYEVGQTISDWNEYAIID